MRELEAELEEERKSKTNAVSAKRKLEGDIKDLEAQLEQANRIKEDGIKQLKKYQVFLRFKKSSILISGVVNPRF